MFEQQEQLSRSESRLRIARLEWMTCCSPSAGLLLSP